MISISGMIGLINEEEEYDLHHQDDWADQRMGEKTNGVTEGGRNLLNNKHVIVICDSIQVKHALIKILHL